MIPVVDLSSDKEDLFPTPHGMRILPRGTSVTSTVVFLGCLVMAASSSSVTNEEEEAREEDAADTDAAPPSAVKSPAPTTSASDADEAPKGVQDGCNGGRTPDQEVSDNSSDTDEADSP
jgi:hypothetical protein